MKSKGATVPPSSPLLSYASCTVRLCPSLLLAMYDAKSGLCFKVGMATLNARSLSYKLPFPNPDPPLTLAMVDNNIKLPIAMGKAFLWLA